MKTCILRGVPSSLRQDGWWLGPVTPVERPEDPPHAAQNPRRYALHALLLGGLIALGLLPWPSSVTPAATPVACGAAGSLGFHTAQDLHSLGAMHTLTTPL